MLKPELFTILVDDIGPSSERPGWLNMLMKNLAVYPPSG